MWGTFYPKGAELTEETENELGILAREWNRHQLLLWVRLQIPLHHEGENRDSLNHIRSFEVSVKLNLLMSIRLSEYTHSWQFSLVLLFWGPHFEGLVSEQTHFTLGFASGIYFKIGQDHNWRDVTELFDTYCTWCTIQSRKSFLPGAIRLYNAHSITHK